MAQETEVGSTAELVPGVVRGAGRYAVGNANGELFAVTRRCRDRVAYLAIHRSRSHDPPAIQKRRGQLVATDDRGARPS
jgi:hypothetical protein